LIERGGDVNALRQDGASPLFKAAHKGYLGVCKTLLRSRPYLGLLPIGETTLHGAIMFGHLDVVKLLIKFGADPNIRNQDGLTAYEFSLRYNNRRISEYLRSLHVEEAHEDAASASSSSSVATAVSTPPNTPIKSVTGSKRQTTV